MLFILTVQSFFTHSLWSYTGKRDFIPIEILMEDRNIKKGFAQDFIFHYILISIIMKKYFINLYDYTIIIFKIDFGNSFSAVYNGHEDSYQLT